MNKKMIAAALLFIGTLAWAADTVFQTEVLMFGKPAAGIKTLKFRKSVSTTQPGIRWSGSAMQFSNDGVTWNTIGSGGTNFNLVRSNATTTTITNNSFVDVGPSINFTPAAGHLVRLGFYTGYWTLTGAGGLNPSMQYQMLVDGVVLDCMYANISQTTINSTFEVPASAICITNNLTQNVSHNIKLQVRQVTIGGNVGVQGVGFYAEDL